MPAGNLTADHPAHALRDERASVGVVTVARWELSAAGDAAPPRACVPLIASVSNPPAEALVRADEPRMIGIAAKEWPGPRHAAR